MPSNIIQWFPGHMAKTKRLIRENLSSVDIILELLDARIPLSSKNPDFKSLIGQKPVITLLNKSSLANDEMTREWVSFLSSSTAGAVAIDCISGKGIEKIEPLIKKELAEKTERYKAKGMIGKPLRAMVLGIPNVGKSSLINRLCGAKKTQVENRPGVTLRKQWVKTSIGVELLDMPGVLWPKFDDRRVGENLAITGAIKSAVLQNEEIAVALCSRLRKICPELLCERYKLPADEIASLEPYDLFLLIGKSRGLLMRGGQINEERCALMLLDEFRSGKIGKITLEKAIV